MSLGRSSLLLKSGVVLSKVGLDVLNNGVHTVLNILSGKRISSSVSQRVLLLNAESTSNLGDHLTLTKSKFVDIGIDWET